MEARVMKLYWIDLLLHYTSPSMTVSARITNVSHNNISCPAKMSYPIFDRPEVFHSILKKHTGPLILQARLRMGLPM